MEKKPAVKTPTKNKPPKILALLATEGLSNVSENAIPTDQTSGEHRQYLLDVAQMVPIDTHCRVGPCAIKHKFSMPPLQHLTTSEVIMAMRHLVPAVFHAFSIGNIF